MVKVLSPTETDHPGSSPKPMVACGSVSISPRGDSVLPWIQGLDTVKKWQRSFFYVKSAEGYDALNLHAASGGREEF